MDHASISWSRISATSGNTQVGKLSQMDKLWHVQRSGWCRWTICRASPPRTRSRSAGTRASLSRGTAQEPSRRLSAAPGSSPDARRVSGDWSLPPRSSTAPLPTPLAVHNKIDDKSTLCEGAFISPISHCRLTSFSPLGKLATRNICSAYVNFFF